MFTIQWMFMLVIVQCSVVSEGYFRCFSRLRRVHQFTASGNPLNWRHGCLSDISAWEWLICQLCGTVILFMAWLIWIAIGWWSRSLIGLLCCLSDSQRRTLWWWEMWHTGHAAWTTSLPALWGPTSWCIMGTVVSVSCTNTHTHTHTHTQFLYVN